jgi:nucleotide-binding universal stress UspA family protein
VQARLRADGARLASAVTLTGAVGQTLARYVQELGIDLVVMATHGRGGVQRAWLGSVADHLVRHLVIPVLLVRPPEGRASTAPTPGHQILVPLDGSPLAEEVLRPAEALGRLWQAELCLVQVVRPVLRVVDLAAPLPTAYDDELTAVRRTQAQDYLDDVAAGLRARGLRATIAAVVGWHPAQTILDLARPERVALVALATHGRGGLRRWALGSVADKLVRGADVPVLVQRPSAPAKRQRTRRGPRAGTRKGGDDVR